MRQIKFREWDPDREKMYGKGHGMSYSDRLESDNATMFVFDHEESDDNREEEKDVNGTPFRRLMQYTGLHDKNGREVYEDDIVKNEYGDVVVVHYGKQDHEEDYGDRFVYQGWNIQIGSGYPDAVMIEYTVIGNIYENPELMEVAEHDAD